jgi:shikimate kinase
VTRRVLLVGMMGAGKTTVGQLVAGTLGWTYRDTDADIEAATGETVPQLFAGQGETAFRAAEAEAVARACATDEPSVISLGGGAVLSPANRTLIASSGTVVWLRARPEILAARLGDGAGRPLLHNGDDPGTALVELDYTRAPLYAEVAHLTVDVDDLTPAEVAERIVAAVTA